MTMAPAPSRGVTATVFVTSTGGVVSGAALGGGLTTRTGTLGAQAVNNRQRLLRTKGLVIARSRNSLGDTAPYRAAGRACGGCTMAPTRRHTDLHFRS